MLKKLQFQLFLTLGFWLSAIVSGIAQTYPVTISTQITQPSPIYLSNYADASTINSPIKVQIALNDLTISNRQIRLKCYFQGQSISLMTNDFVVGAHDLFLEGGVPLQLTNVDLAPYFQYQNLLGINPNQYAQALPEGIYTFSVEVYDFATNKKLSKKTSVTTVIFQNDPPFLNLPLNNASIMQQNIQNIVFSWTPRQINVSNVEYEFSLVEIWDKYTPIQNAFAYSPPLFTTTTRSTTLQYGVSEPQLIPGKRYAWRVKAKALLGAEEVGVFKNNGFSEIYSFDYEVFCTAPLAINVEGISENQAKVTWSGNLDNFDYQVNYREKNADSEWYKIVTPRESVTISNLKPNTTYEYSVGASCDVGKYTHSTVKEFQTLVRDEIAFQGCGIKPDPADLANTSPLATLFPNDVIAAGDFPVVVLHATGSNGTFSGDGYVTFPFLEKFRKLIDAADALAGKDENGESKGSIGENTRIRITFNNIGLNTDFKLISGEIIASYDAEWKGMVDGDQILTDVFGSDGKPVEGTLDYVVKSATLNPDGTVTIKGENGAVTTLAKSPYERVFTDKDGKTVTIPANGKGEPTISQGADGGKAVASNTNGVSSSGEVTQISSKDVVIKFSNSLTETVSNKYAYDKMPANGAPKILQTYETIPMAAGGNYNVDYKAVSDLFSKHQEVVYAEATFKNGKSQKDIIFKTSAGEKVDFEWKNETQAEIKLTKKFEFGKYSIIATVKGKEEKNPQDSTKTVQGKSEIAGKVNVWDLTKKAAINVTFISINGANTPDASVAKKYLNDIYNKVGIQFEVTTQKVTIGTLPNEIKCGDSDIFNVYTDDQNSIIGQIESNTDFKYNDKTYYVLYTGKAGQNAYKGFMPLGGQYAFVFNSGDLRTAAHELGHGIFGLKHPFSNSGESGKTDLLMDYGTGTVLSHNDWDIIHSGGWKFYGFQKSSSGAQISDRNNFLMPNHKPFRFRDSDANSININIAGQDALNVPSISDLQKYPNSNGTLFSFKSNGKTYNFDPKEGGVYVQEGSGMSYTNAYSDANADKPFLLLIRNECYYYFVIRKLSKEEYENPSLDTSKYVLLHNTCPSDSEALCKERLQVIANYMKSSESDFLLTYEALALTNQGSVNRSESGNSADDFKYRKFTVGENSTEIHSYFNANSGYNAKPYLIKSNNKVLLDHEIKDFWLYMGTNNITASGDLKVEIALEKAGNTTSKLTEGNYCSLTDVSLRRGQYTPDVGNFYLGAILAPMAGIAIAEAGTAVGLQTLTESLAQYYSQESLKKCLVGASVDLALQYGINRILKEEGEEPETLSMANATLACATNTLINDKNIILATTIYSFGDNIIKQIQSGKSLSQIEISESAYAALKGAILAIPFKALSVYATNQNWGTRVTQKITNVLERVAIKNNFAKSSISSFIRKTTAGTMLFFASHQMPMVKAADKFVVKIELATVKEATSKAITEVVEPNVRAISETMLNEVETLVEGKAGSIFQSKVGITKVGNIDILSYIKGDNIICYFKEPAENLAQDIYEFVCKFDPNQGLTLASVLATVKNPNTSNCTACTKQDQATCKKFEQLIAKTGPNAGITKLCEGLTKTNVNEVMDYLLLMDNPKLLNFLKDINGAGNNNTIQNNIANLNRSILSSWENLTLQEKESKYVRVNYNYLSIFNKQKDNVQKLIAMFTDNDESTALKKFLDDVNNDDIFKTFINNTDNERYVRGFVNHKLEGADVVDLGAMLSESGLNELVEKWLRRSQRIEEFKGYSQKGTELSNNIATELENKSSKLFISLKSTLGISDLESYTILKEVALTTSGGFMKADILFVKKNLITQLIEDIVIVENKLSKTTDYTDRQKEGFGAILNGTKTMNVKFSVFYNGTEYIAANTLIPVSKNKIIKIYDHGTTSVSNTEIISIASIK
ncbi:fibronectin type III domain-containing protein [Flavobacterium panacagri]|uniref:fibronectin type III domain-containing protein n=1 Tax=Flavobacterium panacagri TaxID=3034146 RepID=UPI0025A5835A|nr:fibronectin type III domain-containing protein [Flavobacterium panacagri]